MKLVITDNLKYRGCTNCFTAFIHDEKNTYSSIQDGQPTLMIRCPECKKELKEQYSLSLKFMLQV